MHFILTHSIAEIEDWTEHKIAAIEKIANSAFYGNHILTIESPKVAEHLLHTKDNPFSKTTLGVIKKCLAKYSLQGEIKNKISFHRKIATRSAIEKLSTNHPEYIAIEDIGNISLDPTTILSENIIDSKIFRHAGQHAIIKRKLKGINIRATTRGGNGEGIYDELSSIAQDEKRLCLAITDSDRDCPEKGDSTKSTECKKIAAKNSKTTGHITLPVREIENLIPVNVWMEIIDDDGKDKVQNYQSILSKNPNIRIFGDIKDGITIAKANKIKESTPEYKFLYKLITEAKLASGCNQNRCDSEKCKCFVIPKLGNNLSNRFIEWLSQKSSPKSLEFFTGEWEESWIEVGDHVLDWCCGAEQARS